LTYPLKGVWAFSINDDYRVLFEFFDTQKQIVTRHTKSKVLAGSVRW
jgi:plasmid maintenance system killer protein